MNEQKKKNFTPPQLSRQHTDFCRRILEQGLSKARADAVCALVPPCLAAQTAHVAHLNAKRPVARRQVFGVAGWGEGGRRMVQGSVSDAPSRKGEKTAGAAYDSRGAPLSTSNFSCMLSLRLSSSSSLVSPSSASARLCVCVMYM